jgi:hypothetical protein
MAREPDPSEEAQAGGKAKPGETADQGAPREGGKRTRKIVTGAAIGIGSAALVAALLYANRSRKTDDRK